MSERAEKLQDAIGMVSDEYVLEAHGLQEREATESAADGAVEERSAQAVARGVDAGAALGAIDEPANPNGQKDDGESKDRNESKAVGDPAVAGELKGADESKTAVGEEGLVEPGASAESKSIGGLAIVDGSKEPGNPEAADDPKAAETFRAQATGGQPQPRKRKSAAKPLAIAACLALALGVGALAFSSLQPSPVNEAMVEDREALTVESKTADSGAMMTMESAADGAVAGAHDASRADGTLTVGRPAPNRVEGEAFVLTAGEWNDNGNWPFFTNLVNSGAVAFPVFGIDPTHRVKATVADAAGNPMRGETVVLRDEAGGELWRAVSGKDGAAYLFYRNGQVPASVSCNGSEQALIAFADDAEDRQGAPLTTIIDDVTLTVGASPTFTANGLQVMFIVDTTGSMSDEIAYLQKDFASIAGDVGGGDVSYSVNFYRDEGDDYVTKCNGFTNDVATVQALLNAEYADGGGDTPEAVADILAETITANGDWRADCNKVAFLIFDAPPHSGTDAVLDAAVRSAAERGIRLVPVVASNAERETELFGRALAICTGGTYVFLTDDSGVGESHLEPIIGDYSVELLHDVIVRIIQQNR